VMSSVFTQLPVEYVRKGKETCANGVSRSLDHSIVQTSIEE
jgi:hypothetical protein